MAGRELSLLRMNPLVPQLELSEEINDRNIVERQTRLNCSGHAPFSLRHLARCEAAIFRRAAADMVRLLSLPTLAMGMTFCWPLTLAHRARAAAAIRARPAAEMRRLG